MLKCVYDLSLLQFVRYFTFAISYHFGGVTINTAKVQLKCRIFLKIRYFNGVFARQFVLKNSLLRDISFAIFGYADIY
jgi:hypothetical protein